jgi:hypothetical protein
MCNKSFEGWSARHHFHETKPPYNTEIKQIGELG